MHTHKPHAHIQQLSVGLAPHPDCKPPENILAWIRGVSRSAREYDTEVNNETENLERKVYIVRDANEIHRMDDTEKSGTRNEGIIIELESGSFREDLKSGQASDPVTARAIEQLREKGCISHRCFKKFKGMKLEEGILYCSRRVIIPASMSNRVIQTIHEFSHWGVQRTFEMVRKKFH